MRAEIDSRPGKHTSKLVARGTLGLGEGRGRMGNVEEHMGGHMDPHRGC